MRAGVAPFLQRAASLPEKIEPAKYPFTIPACSHGLDVTFRTKVTFFVGENLLLMLEPGLSRWLRPWWAVWR